MRIFSDFNEIKSAVGTEIGASDWIEVTQDRINRFAEATCDEQWNPCRPGARQKGTARRHHHCPRPVVARARTSLHPVGDRAEGIAHHAELRRGQNTISGAGAGGVEAARPRHGRRSGGRAAGWLARQLSFRDRNRGRQAPGLCCRADCSALSVNRRRRPRSIDDVIAAIDIQGHCR